MHGILGATHTRRNPRNCPAIRQTFARNENYAYPDTLGIFMRYWPAGALKTIARLQRGGGDVQLKRSLYKDPLGNFRVYQGARLNYRPGAVGSPLVADPQRRTAELDQVRRLLFPSLPPDDGWARIDRALSAARDAKRLDAIEDLAERRVRRLLDLIP